MQTIDDDKASNFSFGFHYIDNRIKGKDLEKLNKIDQWDQLIDREINSLTLRESSNIFEFDDHYT